MNSTRLKLSAIAVFLFVAAGAAFAEGSAPVPPGEAAAASSAAEDERGCHDWARVALPIEAPWISLALDNARRIGLSEEQTRELDTLRSEFAQTVARQTRTMVTAEDALQQLLAAEPVKLERVAAKLDEIAALRVTLRLRRIEALLAGRGLLSTEQLASLQTLTARAAADVHEAMMESFDGQVEPEPPTGVM
jgi:Spy/CpxP family protein refolding chaperone